MDLYGETKKQSNKQLSNASVYRNHERGVQLQAGGAQRQSKVHATREVL